MKRILVLLLLLPLALAACGSLTETADTPRAQCERKAQDDPAVQRLAGDVTSGDYMVQYNARAAQREAVRQATLRCLRLRGLAPPGGVEPVQGGGLF